MWLAFVVAFVFLLMTYGRAQLIHIMSSYMCVYQHPRLFHHLIALLLRWRDAA